MTSEIVKNILTQLGGNKFLVMTGSKDLTEIDEYTLRMKLSKNKSNANYLYVRLNAKDLYDLNFKKIQLKNGEYSEKVIAARCDVYCNNLQSVFTEVTGLYTKL